MGDVHRCNILKITASSTKSFKNCLHHKNAAAKLIGTFSALQWQRPIRRDEKLNSVSRANIS
jgi:hypothetical protein